RVQPELQPIEVESMRGHDDDFAVDDDAGWKLFQQRVVKLGEIAIERPEIAALDVDVRRTAKHDGAKPVPLRFVEKVAISRQRICQLRQHRLDGRFDREGHARARFRSGAERTASGFFFDALTASRLLRNASMRFTTFGGASISCATTSRPSTFASMISRSPSWYSSRYDLKSSSPSNVPITCCASFTSAGLTASGMSLSSSMASMLRISLACRRVYMTMPRSRGCTLIRYSRPYSATFPMPAFPFIPSRITANASFATGPSVA